MSKNTNELKTRTPRRFGLKVSRLGSPMEAVLPQLALIAKSSKHENAKQPHWAQARSSCWGTRSPPL